MVLAVCEAVEAVMPMVVELCGAGRTLVRFDRVADQAAVNKSFPQYSWTQAEVYKSNA
jgi:hypothetical protein